MHAEQSLKLQAAMHALTYIESGMVVGLGHGSTAILAVRGLAEKIVQGELNDIQGIPCSRQIEVEARRLGIPLTTLEDHPVIDMTIDGADEVDPVLNLISVLTLILTGRQRSRLSTLARNGPSVLRSGPKTIAITRGPKRRHDQ